MSILPTTLLNDKPVPQHVLASIVQAAAAKFPQWADNEHPDARAYNAYQLGALDYYLSTEAVAPVAAEGYEQLREVLTKYVACNEATADEVFLRFRGGRRWTRAEFVQELRENGPQALDMMVSLMATAAYLLTKDKKFPIPAPTAVGAAAYKEKAGAFDQIDIIEEALRAMRAERSNTTVYALEDAVATCLPKIQRALGALAHLAGDPTLVGLGPVLPTPEDKAS